MPDNLLDTGDAGSLSDVFTSPTCAFKPISWFHGFSFLLPCKPCRFQTVRICFKGSWHFHAFPPSCGPFLIISTTYERPPWTPSPRDTNEARLRRRARNFTSAQVMITISYLDLSQGAKWFPLLGFNWHPLESAGILVTSALPVVFSALPVLWNFHIWRICRSNRRVLCIWPSCVEHFNFKWLGDDITISHPNMETNQLHVTMGLYHKQLCLKVFFTNLSHWMGSFLSWPS